MRFALIALVMLAACEQNVRYVEATPVAEVSAATIAGPED